MNDKNYEVLTNIIGAVESGGQVYGKRRYEAYADPYTNSPKEHTITLGAFQSYGYEANELMNMIFEHDPDTFRAIDKDHSIEAMLPKDWVALKWKPTETQKQRIIKIITTETGKAMQDKQFKENRLKKYIARAEKFGISDIPTQMMWAEVQHLGGVSPTERVFRRCNGSYGVDSVMTALKKDQAETGSNSVSSKKYWSRHEKCAEFVKKYAEVESVTTIVDEFTKYIGTVEYNGIVATIQKWFYGSLVKDAWCATSTSYFANVAGILDQIGGKNEGVSEMMAACRRLHKSDGRFFEYPNIPRDLKKHDIVFLKRNGASHVCHCWKDCTYTGTGYINVLGGNQSDMICKKDYEQNKIQAIYRPVYSGTPSGGGIMLKVESVSSGKNGMSTLLLQEVLKARGFKGLNGTDLILDGDCGSNTVYAINTYQDARRKQGVELGTNGQSDGCCGSKMWNDITGGLVV